jgi:glycerophosphoryl diester phosphodiesterase
VAREVVLRKRTHQAFLACTRSAAEAAQKVHAEILICNMDRQGTSTRYVDETLAGKCAFIQLAGWPALPDDMRRLRDAGVRINYYGTNSPRMLKPLYDAGVEFPLVDDVGPMLDAAGKLGIEPLVPVYPDKAR